jgi:hypothetical protein
MSLTIRRGKEPIGVWRRRGWTSMAHLIVEEVGVGFETCCGHTVELQAAGVDAMLLTQVSTEQFLAAGCGLCRQSMLRELRAELLAVNPDAKAKMAKFLKEASWTRAK